MFFLLQIDLLSHISPFPRGLQILYKSTLLQLDRHKYLTLGMHLQCHLYNPVNQVSMLLMFFNWRKSFYCPLISTFSVEI
jgi:hypothetical protein